jgi:hypothetical protein
VVGGGWAPTFPAAAESLLDDLLDEFVDVFTEPKVQQRTRDHRIYLKSGSMPVAVRLYRYPALQKDEIERRCRLMEDQGLIRRSLSPFS